MKQTLDLGTSVEGRPLSAVAIGDPGGAAVLFLASIHGDETAGTPLLERLAIELERDASLRRGKRAVLVAVVNPDGVQARRRENHRRVDLNRNFPSGNFKGGGRHGVEPLSEPESRAIFDLIETTAPSLVVALHEPYGCIDFDGPADAIAARMAERCDLPVKKVGSRKGSLGSYVGVDLGVPIVTVEFRAGTHGLAAEQLWDRYGAMLLAALESP